MNHRAAAVGLVFALATGVPASGEAQGIDAIPPVSGLLSASKARTLDPRIVGVWKQKGRNAYLEFKKNQRGFSGTKDTPYEILDDGKKLVINKISTYLRIGGEGKTIVGHWRDDANGEEFLFRPDGRYVGWDDGEAVGYFGRYAVANDTFSGFEFRFLFGAANGKLTFHLPRDFNEVVVPYQITDNDKKLTLKTAAGETVYEKQ